MRAAAKKCALSVSISQSLSVCISGLGLTRPSSGQELTPTVFGFDREAARQGVGGGTVTQSHSRWKLRAPPQAARGRRDDGDAGTRIRQAPSRLYGSGDGRSAVRSFV
jgi:hypothetical protein